MPTEGPSRGANSSNLYLVTFLATLFLLLFVSCAIVLRSYLLRRRFHRRVEQALAQGIVLAPRAPGSRKRRYGLRPTLYENWIAPLHVSGVSGCQLPHTAHGRWVDMLPLTVQTVVVKRRTRESALSPTASPVTTQSPENQYQHPFAPQTSSGTPQTPETQPQGRLGSFFSRFSPAAQPPHGTAPTGGIAFPRGSETPPARERRESTTMANWRTIVTPSPSLVMASGGAVDAARARTRVGSTPGTAPTAEDMRSRRMSLPASPTRTVPNTLHESGGHARGASTPSSLLSVLRGRRNSMAAATSPHEQPPPLPPLPARTPEQTLAPAVDWTSGAGRPRTGITIHTDLPPASTSPATASGIPTAITPGTAVGKTRIRTEMLQISVLVAMPSIGTSALYGDAGVVKSRHEGKAKGTCADAEVMERAENKNERMRDEDEDADEIVEVFGDDSSSIASSLLDHDDDDRRAAGLPELVLGVTRLTYRHLPTNSPPPPPTGAGDKERLSARGLTTGP